MVRKTVIRARLPGPPIEYWTMKRILGTAVEVGRPLAINDFTEQC